VQPISEKLRIIAPFLEANQNAMSGGANHSRDNSDSIVSMILHRSFHRDQHPDQHSIHENIIQPLNG